MGQDNGTIADRDAFIMGALVYVRSEYVPNIDGKGQYGTIYRFVIGHANLHLLVDEGGNPVGLYRKDIDPAGAGGYFGLSQRQPDWLMEIAYMKIMERL